jgi:cell wall-associated NlpC family hydrolase
MKREDRLAFETTDVKRRRRRRLSSYRQESEDISGHDHVAGKSPPSDMVTAAEEKEPGSSEISMRLRKRQRAVYRKRAAGEQNEKEAALPRKASEEDFGSVRTSYHSRRVQQVSEDRPGGEKKNENGRQHMSDRSGRRMKSREVLHRRYEVQENHNAGVRFVDDDSREKTSDADGRKEDKHTVRRMRMKKKKTGLWQRLTQTSDDLPPDDIMGKRETERTVNPQSGRHRRWLALLLAAAVLIIFFGSAISSVSIISAGVISGASSALTENHSSMYTGSAIRQQIVSYAESFIGRGRYVWGGNDLGTPENPGSGTDCSGFVQQVFAKFGISLPRTSYEDANAGVEVDYSEARPGDIIVYAGHVAIYAGDSQIVQAANEELDMCMGSALYAPIQTVRNVIPEEMELSYSGDPIELDDESKHLLATMVYHESGNQSYESKVAIAAEVLNRVKSPHFPNTVYEVLNQKNQYCNTDTEPAFRRMYNSTLPEDCWRAVEDAMNGADPTGGMCFHCTNDYWASHYAGNGWPCLVIDDQTFHNWGREPGYFNTH